MYERRASKGTCFKYGVVGVKLHGLLAVEWYTPKAISCLD